MHIAHALLALLLAGAAPIAAAPDALITASAASQLWSPAAANAWYDRQPWLVGANYIPATAINELERWQAASFDPARIDLELGWAEKADMNTMRVFLHDLLWKQDAPGFTRRIDQFLAVVARHHIRPVLVLFDSCWDPDPNSARSTRQSPASTIRAGSNHPAATISSIPRNALGSRPMSKAWSAISRTIRACSPGTCGTSPITRAAATASPCNSPASRPRSRRCCPRYSAGYAPRGRSSRSPAASGAAGTGRAAAATCRACSTSNSNNRT